MSINQENIVSIRTRANGVRETLSRMREVQQEIRNNARIARRSSSEVVSANRTVARSQNEQIRQSQKALSDFTTSIERSHLRIIRSNERLAKSFQNVQSAQSGSVRDGGRGGLMPSLAGGAAVVGGVALGLRGIRAYDEQEGFKRMMRYQYGPGMGEVMYKQTRQLADELGLPMAEVSQGLKGLSNVLSSSELMETMKSFVAIAYRSGATSEQMSRALIQYTQVAMSGKLQGDELRLMQENGVNIKGLVMRSGLGSRIGSQTDPITFKEINDLLLKEGQSAESQQMLAEAGNTGSAALAKMQNVIEQDLLPALGEELAPAIKKAAEMVPVVAAVGKSVIHNWQRVVIPAVGVWALYKGAQLKGKYSLVRFTMSLDRASASLERNQLQDAMGGGGGGAGKGRGGKAPRVPGKYSDTLGDPGMVSDALKKRGGNWGSKVPWYARPMGGVVGNLAGGAAIGATTGAVIATAGIVAAQAGNFAVAGRRNSNVGSDEALKGRSVEGAMDALHNSDTWAAPAWFGGKGVQTMRESARQMHDMRMKWEAVQAARERFRQFQMKYGRTSMDYYAYKTGDLAVYGDEAVAKARLAAFAAEYESGLAASVSGRPSPSSGAMSPRRAGIDNQLAEQSVRVQRGIGA